jgi:hypothetical protein
MLIYKCEFSFLNCILMAPSGHRPISGRTETIWNGATTPTFLTGANMKTLAFLLAVVCVVVGAMYYALPGGELPTFLPGYAADSTRIHMLHGFAAVTGAVVFLLIGLSTTPYHRPPRSPNSV